MEASSGIQNTWTPIHRIKLSFRVTRNPAQVKGLILMYLIIKFLSILLTIQVIREQYPLVPAEAYTIHKSQGSTLENVTVVLVPRMTRQLIYVAFSRAKTLNGLYILGKFNPPSPPRNDDPVVLEMKRLRESAQLIPKFQHLKTIPANKIQIVSFNVQSIRKHIDSIKSDNVFTKSHVLLFQEVWAMTNERFDIPQMKVIQRNDINNQPQPRGTMIYAETSQMVQPHQKLCFERNSERVEITSCIISNVTLINIYKNPKTSLEFFKLSMTKIQHLFNSDNILVCGDLNEDMSKSRGIIEFLRSKNLHMLSQIEPTTNAGTTIDAVFGRLKDFSFECTIYESLFSHHKPIVIRIKPDFAEYMELRELPTNEINFN